MKTTHTPLPIMVLFSAVLLAAGCQHLHWINPPPAPDLRLSYNRFDTLPKPADTERISRFAEESALGGAVHYEVVGYAYDRKQSGHNFILGKRRADLVRDMLLEAGVPEERVNARSLGDTRPRIPYANFGKRLKFNRVEVFRVVVAE